MSFAPRSWGSGNGAVTYTVAANYGPARTTTITIAGYPVTVSQGAVSAAVLPPAPTLSATSLNFGNQTIGVSTAARTVTLTNGGATTASLSAIMIGGLNSGDLAQTSNCGSALAASASCTCK